MGWEASALGRKEFLILIDVGRNSGGGWVADRAGGITPGIGSGLLGAAGGAGVQGAGVYSFAGSVTDPCDGRTQGTRGMMDSLPYRNDAAIVLRRLIRSLPRRSGVMGVATCDKGLPAMMMALAGARESALHIGPGG